MTVRWWDPGVPVDLLSPGDDPALDAANRLIALHRSGAAALLAAATVPLCDESTIAEALDMAAAVSAVEIAKADALIGADVEVANHAAEALYRSCTARGVIPPVAAVRAAKVYGIPGPMLGRYPALAGDAKTPDLVLTDTADRLLFGWVAATAAAGEIAKAETPEQRRRAQEDEQRNRTGRYARTKEVDPELHIGDQTVTEWLTGQLTSAPEVATAPPAEQTTPRKIRQIRQIRQIKQAGVKPASVKGASAKGASIRAASVRAAAAETAKAKIKLARANLSRISRPVPAMFGDYSDTAGSGAPVPAVSYVLPLDEWEAFRQSAGVGKPGQAVFLAGDLATYVLGAPEGYTDTAGSAGHAETVAYVADQVRSQPDKVDAPEPVIWELTDDEQHQLDVIDDRGVERRLLEKFKVDRLRKRQDELGLDDRDIPVGREIAHVDHYVDADDPDKTLLVYKPPQSYDATAYHSHRPEIVLAEIDVTGGHGRMVDPGSGEQAILNPELGLGAADDPLPLMKYDRRLKVAILVVDATTVTSAEVEAAKRGQSRRSWIKDIKKAETPEQRRRAVAEEPRGGGGRWVAVATGRTQEPTIAGQPVADWLADQLAGAEEAPAAAPEPRKIRQIRQIRQIKQAGVKPASVKGASVKEAQVLAAAARTAAVARAGTKVGADELPLDDGSEYLVLSEHTMKRRLGVYSTGDEFTLDPEGREWLANQGHRSAEDVVVDLYKRGREEWLENVERVNDRVLVKTTYDAGGVDEYGDRAAELEAIETLADDLHRRFGQDKKLQGLEVQMRRVLVSGGHDRVYVTVLAHPVSLDVHQVIRRGDVEPGAPQVLSFERRARAMTRDQIRNTLRSYWPSIDPANPFSSEQTAWLVNQWVDSWEVHTPEEFLRDT